MLIYLLKGSLPWQGLKCTDKTEKYNKIKEIKNNIDPLKLCDGLPGKNKSKKSGIR
jgi:casein kinase 1